MTVIYADSVFFLNALMDYLLLLATARLAGIPLRRWRYLLAALLGGSYAVACFLPGAGFLSQSPVKAASGVLLALVAFGGEERLARLTVLLFSLSCGLAGCVLALGLFSGGGVPAVNGIFYTDVSFRVLLIAATAAYLVLTVVFRAAAANRVRGEVLPVRLSIGGRVVEFSALHDTGNGLRDPVSGQAVLVVSCDAAAPGLPQEVRGLITPHALRFPAETMEKLHQAAPWLRPRLLPYHAVGAENGLLLAVKTDWTEVAGIRYPGLMAALSPTRMETPALWGGAVGKEGKDDRVSRFAKAADPLGTAGSPGRPLHRRQRYAPAAAVQRAGGGAFEPSGPGGGPEGTHRT